MLKGPHFSALNLPTGAEQIIYIEGESYEKTPSLAADCGFGALPTTSGGTDYHIWRNKFGIDGVDESVPQLMVKWTM